MTEKEREEFYKKKAAEQGITVEELKKIRADRFCAHKGEFRITDPKTGKVLSDIQKAD